jgi:hypothetical protein
MCIMESFNFVHSILFLLLEPQLLVLPLLFLVLFSLIA